MSPFRIEIALQRLMIVAFAALTLTAAAQSPSTPAKVPPEKPGMAYRPERRIIWHEIQTTDVAAAARFYTTVFGWTKVDAPTVKGDRPYLMLQRDDNVFAGIVPLSEYGSKGSPRWQAWIGVADVEEAVEAVIKAGGLLEKPVFDHLLGRTAFVGDAAQARFAIVKPHFRQPFIFQLPLTWHVVQAPETDLQGLSAFYKTIFNWDNADVMFSLRTTLPVLTTGGVRIAGLVTPQWGTAESKSSAAVEASWLTCVEVDDLRSSLARFAAGGGKQLAPDDEIPGFGRVVRVADPQGAELILLQRAPQNI